MANQITVSEWFDLVTPDGGVIGKALRSDVHGNPTMLHPVAHVHILNAKGEIFMQKRAPDKDLFPNSWDTAVGGHVNSGEPVSAAVYREAREELNITGAEFTFMFRYVMTNPHESELVHAYLYRSDGPFRFNPDEISDARFWSTGDIYDSLGKKIFTPNFEQEFARLKKMTLF